MNQFKFGDRVECIHASESNPQKRGFFVREGLRPRGAINSGPYFEITDGKGVFWESPPENVRRDDWEPCSVLRGYERRINEQGYLETRSIPEVSR